MSNIDYEFEGEVRFTILRTEINNAQPKQIATFYCVEKGNTGKVLFYETVIREKSKVVERIRHPIENFHMAKFNHCMILNDLAIRAHPLRIISLAMDGRGDIEEVEASMKTLGLEGTVRRS